jgi:hypothetical protein
LFVWFFFWRRLGGWGERLGGRVMCDCLCV